MFSRHVTKDISAYCHGELSSEESKQFAEHIIACAKCRTKYEEIKLGIKLAEQLPQLSAPDHLWDELEALLENEGEVFSKAAPGRRTPRRRWVAFAAAAAALLIAGIGGLWLYSNRPSPSLPGPSIASTKPSWRVKRLNGTPKIGSERISDDGQLGLGEVLETDGSSRARIAVGSIGNVDVDENTRIKLLATQPTEHRLELTRGKMSAQIWAPPRLFFVDTPSAVAADLGCAYTLEVDDHGASLLRVTSGWVALQLKDRESIVPAGAACETRRELGPGTPYFMDASAAFREALKKVDFNDNASTRSAALTSLLDQARHRDTLTLWHLLARVDGEDRVRVYEKLAAFALPPAGVTREGILNLDQKMLEAWRHTLELTWSPGGIGKSKTDPYWKLKKGLSSGMKDKIPK
jgi:ferric-dicitrate binding protein FerR (iron transport regulator)